MPTRGLLGLRNVILTASRGTAILNTVFYDYGEWAGDINTRDQGSLVNFNIQNLNKIGDTSPWCTLSNWNVLQIIQVAFETGATTSYALFSCQERGQMFVGSGIEVYKGQIIGIHQRSGDLSLNACKKKAATNVRSNKEQTGIYT